MGGREFAEIAMEGDHGSGSRVLLKSPPGQAKDTAYG